MAKNRGGGPPPAPQIRPLICDIDGKISANQISLEVGIAAPLADGSPQDQAFEAKKFTGIVDTGATMTVVHPDVVAAVNLPIIGSGKSFVADGKLVVHHVVLAVFWFTGRDGRVISKKIPSAVMPGTNRVLFGMDLMTGATFNVDGHSMTWKLRIKC